MKVPSTMYLLTKLVRFFLWIFVLADILFFVCFLFEGYDENLKLEHTNVVIMFLICVTSFLTLINYLLNKRKKEP